MNLRERFDALDDNLKLDPAVRRKAEQVHNGLGHHLVTAGVAKRTRLQGSFARHTMRGPQLHDIDKVVELVDSLHEILTRPGGPQKAMAIIQDVLAPLLPGARFESKKHALAIALPGDGFNFDAVPAFNPENGTGWICIADSDDDRWESSNTYILIDTVAARNQACDGLFVRQVRMAKQAVYQAGMSEILPGLHVESFAYAAITVPLDHAQAVTATLSMGAQLLGGTYNDPTGADQISDRLALGEVATAKAAMLRLAERTIEAQRLAATGGDTAAANIWADVFGHPFPRPENGEKRFLQSLYVGGGTVATGAATSGRTPTTRAWRP